MVRYNILLILSFIFLLGCKKEISIPLEDTISKLVVNANLDNDLQVFSINLSTSRPISTKIPARSLPEKIEIRLYHNNQLVPMDELVLLPQSSNSKAGSMKIQSQEVGSIFHLEVEAEGFPTAEATIAIPPKPKVSKYVSLYPKMEEMNMDRVWNPENFYFNCSYFIPYNLKMESTGDSKEYYLIKSLKINQQSEEYTSNNAIGILNRMLLQDDPQTENEALLNNPDYNFFVFENFVLSNFSFTSGVSNLELLIGNCDFSSNRPKNSLITLHVTRLTSEAYHYIRSVMIQSKDFNFLNEPIAIESNVLNGYGCFSVTSTVSFPIFIFR